MVAREVGDKIRFDCTYVRWSRY